MSSTESVESKFKLHVSFAEADIEFVDSVLAALGQLDRFDLSVTPGGQEDAKGWVKDAGALIEAADAVVYVLSPASVGFPTVAYEAEKASALSKRMVPIVSQPLRKAELPAALTGLRPIRMETEQLFDSNFRQLLRLLDKDANWIQLHTQLYIRARSWQEQDYDNALLLSSAEVAAAKAWTFERSTDAPKPTDLHMDFIEASEAAPMGLQNGARRAPPPAAKQRARRKPKLATPEARLVADMPAAEPATPDVFVEPDKPAILFPVADDALELPDIVEDADQAATPSAAADEEGNSELPLESDAPVPEAEHAVAEEPTEPVDRPKKRTATAKSKLGRLRRRRTTPAKASPKEPAKAPAMSPAKARATAPVKPPVKTISVDLGTLAYVPASLKISRAPNDRPCPAPADAASLPDIATSKVPDAHPQTALPDGMEDPATTPSKEAAEVKPTGDADQAASPPAQSTSNTDTSPLIAAAKPKTTKRPHPVIIAQDELDGLLSSLMADAENDRT